MRALRDGVIPRRKIAAAVGLPAMAQYDVQFALDDGVGTSVTFVERCAASP